MIPENFCKALPRGVFPPHGRSELYAFAGFDREQHVDVDGIFQRGAYELRHITRVNAPEALVYAGKKVQRIACHRGVHSYLLAALTQVSKAGLWHVIRVYGGGFEPRLVRGGGDWSVHTFGMALDFDPDRNPLGAPPEKTFIGGTHDGLRVVEIMAAWGWYWGGHFDGRKDAMHFQFCTGA
jgi:hypothetical protein